MDDLQAEYRKEMNIAEQSGIVTNNGSISNDRPTAYEILWRLIFIVALLFGLALSSLGFLAMRFPCSEMKISEIGPACGFGDDHVSDVDARIGQWFAVAGGVIALWGFGSLLLKR
jgi:hypothetical protein